MIWTKEQLKERLNKASEDAKKRLTKKQAEGYERAITDVLYMIDYEGGFFRSEDG